MLGGDSCHHTYSNGLFAIAIVRRTRANPAQEVSPRFLCRLGNALEWAEGGDASQCVGSLEPGQGSRMSW